MNRGRGIGEGGEYAPYDARPDVEELDFVIELWDIGRREPEKVLGRAHRFDVATVIYDAAVEQQPCRRITLRRGNAILRATA